MAIPGDIKERKNNKSAYSLELIFYSQYRSLKSA